MRGGQVHLRWSPKERAAKVATPPPVLPPWDPCLQPRSQAPSPCGPTSVHVMVHMKAFTFEMHHTRADFTNPGENIGLNITGLDMINMPGSGDVIVCTDFTVKMHHTRSDFASSGATLA